MTLLTGFCLKDNCSYVMLFIIKTKVYPPKQTLTNLGYSVWNIWNSCSDDL